MGQRPKTPGWWLWVVVAVAAVAVLFIGYRGVGFHSSNSNVSSADKLAPIHEPTLPQNGFTWKYQAYSLDTAKPAFLARGSNITVVMLMASWCKYCAYDDKYVWPALLNTPGITVDIVDVSTNGGIGDPGPEQPAFTGQDHPTGTIGADGMLKVMKRYAKRFDLNRDHVHVYVDPKGMTYWSVTRFPTFIFLNAKGQPVERIDGAITVPQAKSVVHTIVTRSKG